jgi:hypothetical protein
MLASLRHPRCPRRAIRPRTPLPSHLAAASRAVCAPLVVPPPAERASSRIVLLVGACFQPPNVLLGAFPPQAVQLRPWHRAVITAGPPVITSDLLGYPGD